RRRSTRHLFARRGCALRRGGRPVARDPRPRRADPRARLGLAHARLHRGRGIAVDPEGIVYAAGSPSISGSGGVHTVVKYRPDGVYLGRLSGDPKSLFRYPQGVAIGASGAVYVADHRDRVVKLSADG